MGYWGHVRDRLRYVSTLQLGLDILAKCGLFFQPYYVLRENVDDGDVPTAAAKSPDYEFARFEAEDMRAMAEIPERDISEAVLLERLHGGMRCFGARHKGRPVAFTWCNLKECSYPGYRFPLAHDEAYLFDAHTTVSDRGKKLAPQVRSFVYEEMKKIDRVFLYSVSERLNRRAVRFKMKLNARIVDRGIYVVFCNRWHYSTKAHGWREMRRRSR
jgi:hypothetical protein